jgi:anti-sigma factor RsiW
MNLTDHISDVQLNEYLDHETAHRAEIEAHLNACGECAERLSTFQALFTELNSLPEATLTRDLAVCFMPDRKHPSFPPWLTLTAALQAAAAAAVLIFAMPVLPVLIPRVELPSITILFSQFQVHWQVFMNAFFSFHLPALTPLPIPVIGLSTLLITLAGMFVLWILGNGMLLRHRS